MSDEAPLVTVLVATSGRGRTVRRTLRHLRAQTIGRRIELVLIGPDEGSFGDLADEETAGFARCRRMAVGPFDEVERAFVPGIRAATAPIVALLENHVYPEPGWAAAQNDRPEFQLFQAAADINIFHVRRDSHTPAIQSF